MVTVCATFQFSGVKVIVAGDRDTTSLEEESGMVTGAVGVEVSTAVQLPDSPQVGDASTAVNSIPKGTSNTLTVIGLVVV